MFLKTTVLERMAVLCIHFVENWKFNKLSSFFIFVNNAYYYIFFQSENQMLDLKALLYWTSHIYHGAHQNYQNIFMVFSATSDTYVTYKRLYSFK